ncbi:hypothetical protein [Diplocloster agilis]|nr:hypothetical protein [Suonthocola fibrivorans]
MLSLGYSKQLLTNYEKEGLLERCRHGVISCRIPCMMICIL